MEKSEVAVITTHIDPALGYGGPAVSVATLVTTWAKMGYRLLLCSSNASETAALTQQDVDFGENVNATLYPCQWFKRWGFDLRAITFIYNVCRKAPFIYINGVATWPTSVAAVLCCIMKRRFVVSLRGGLMAEHVDRIKQYKFHKWLYYKLLTFPTLRRSAVIHCTSIIEAEAARQLLNRRSGLAVIPNGVDTERIKPKAMPNFDGLIFCYAGRISIEKGINEFIRAWLGQRRKNDKLVVAGSGHGNYFEQFKLLVEESKGAILYKGYLDRDALLETICDSHIVILPSGLKDTNVRENFGNIVAEAFALGRAVMVTQGLAWDHIEKNSIGFLFNRNSDSVCKAIMRAQRLSSRSLQQMGAAARTYAKRNLDSSILAEKLWTAIMDL